MPNWKKVIVSGSNAVLNQITASGAIVSTNANSNLSGSFSGSFQGDGSNLTGISAGTNLTQSIFVTQNGDDITGTVGDITKPFATLVSASQAATTGSTIFVYPGTYEVIFPTNLAKPGVDYYFYPGSTVTRDSGGTTFDVTGFVDGEPCNVYGHANWELGSNSYHLWNGEPNWSYTFQANNITSDSTYTIVNGFTGNSSDIASWEFRMMSSSAGNAFYQQDGTNNGLLHIDCDKIITKNVCIGTANGQHSGIIKAKRMESTNDFAFDGYPNFNGWTFLVDEAVGVGSLPGMSQTKGAYKFIQGTSGNSIIIGNASGILLGEGNGSGGFDGVLHHTGYTQYLEADAMNAESKYIGGRVDHLRQDSSGIIDFNWSPPDLGGSITNTGRIDQTNGTIYADCSAHTSFSNHIVISGGTFIGRGSLSNQYPIGQITISGGEFIWKGIMDFFVNSTNYGSVRNIINLSGGVCKIEGTINIDGANFTSNLPSRIIDFDGGKLILNGATLTTVDTTQPTPAIYPDQNRDVHVFSGGINYNQTGSNALLAASGSGYSLTNILGGIIIEDTSVE